ncbi:hypothetical protein BC835DRAFT_1302546 [Cytidiella melzeri]|nr:hypothetical protein BC835DRAFT_1302546 [Cytidiella melzeri]
MLSYGRHRDLSVHVVFYELLTYTEGVIWYKSDSAGIEPVETKTDKQSEQDSKGKTLAVIVDCSRHSSVRSRKLCTWKAARKDPLNPTNSQSIETFFPLKEETQPKPSQAGLGKRTRSTTSTVVSASDGLQAYSYGGESEEDIEDSDDELKRHLRWAGNSLNAPAFRKSESSLSHLMFSQPFGLVEAPSFHRPCDLPSETSGTGIIINRTGLDTTKVLILPIVLS